MRILLSGGGTGGHVYPVLTVVERLLAEKRGVERSGLLYLGGSESFEEQLARGSGTPFRSISVGGLRGASPMAVVRNAARLLKGTVQCWQTIASFKPDVTFVTGGYVSVPAILASWWRRCPVLIYLPDLVPGWAIRATARFARYIAVSFPESTRYFSDGKAVVTGYPVRSEFYQAAGDEGKRKEAARRQLGLLPDAPTLLVFGGSRAAHSINVAVAENLSQLLSLAQIIHICGAEDLAWLEEERSKLGSGRQERYHLYAYLYTEMASAMAASDLAVARAGAATLGEFPALGLPSILVPYPYSGQHQGANADYMVKAGAARKIEDSRLRDELAPLVTELLGSPETLEAMGRNARRLARPDAARNIASLLQRLARRQNPDSSQGDGHGSYSD